MTMCVQKEERLVMELGESAMLDTTRGMNKRTDTSQASTSKSNQKGNVEYLLKLISKRKISVSFVLRKDT